MNDLPTRHALVFAIAHELGNQLAAIRLEAHLLDDTLGTRGLAKASLAIDGLAGQASPWLALIRPLLEPRPRGSGMATCASVLEAVRRQLEEEGTGGRPVEVVIEDPRAGACAAFEGMHALLVALVGSTDGRPAGGGAIRLGVGLRGERVEVACEVPGADFSESDSDAPQSSLRGRGLALSIARVLVADAGGEVAVAARGERSRTEWRMRPA